MLYLSIRRFATALAACMVLNACAETDTESVEQPLESVAAPAAEAPAASELETAAMGVTQESDGGPDLSDVVTVTQALVADDGNLTVSTAGTVLNQYVRLSANAAAGATSISVTTRNNLNSPTFGNLAAGDLLLIIQMQGATITTTNNDTYGTISNLNNAGRYELATVESLSGGSTINLSCALQNSYTSSGNAQVIRVPQLENLTITGAGSIVATPWNGQLGGVVAVQVAGTTTINGAIDVSGQGFRGGAVDNVSTSSGTQVTLYRGNDEEDGGEKGESVAGVATSLSNGEFGRGAPANGGGGGNSHNAGGGGGANASNGNAWTGAGVMGAVTGAAAWTLCVNESETTGLRNLATFGGSAVGFVDASGDGSAG